MRRTCPTCNTKVVVMLKSHSATREGILENGRVEFFHLRRSPHNSGEGDHDWVVPLPGDPKKHDSFLSKFGL